LDNLEENAARIVIATWTGEQDDSYIAAIEVVAADRSGLLADITATVAQGKIFITASNSRILKNGNASINFTLEIESMEQLDKLMTKIKKIDGVISVERGCSQ
jgi:GTP pyrophosphokinase